MSNKICKECEELYNEDDVKFEEDKCQECLEEDDDYGEKVWYNIAEAEATGNQSSCNHNRIGDNR